MINSLEIIRNYPDEPEWGFLNILGLFLSRKLDLNVSPTILNRCLRFYETQNDQWGIALTHDAVAGYYSREECEKAKIHAQKGLLLRQVPGDIWGISMSLSNLGNIHENAGELPEAKHYYQESLKYRRQLQEDPDGVLDCLEGLGQISQKLGDNKSALNYFREGLILAEKQSNPTRIYLFSSWIKNPHTHRITQDIVQDSM